MINKLAWLGCIKLSPPGSCLRYLTVGSGPAGRAPEPFRTIQERIPGRAIQNILLPLPAQVSVTSRLTLTLLEPDPAQR